MQNDTFFATGSSPPLQEECCLFMSIYECCDNVCVALKKRHIQQKELCAICFNDAFMPSIVTMFFIVNFVKFDGPMAYRVVHKVLPILFTFTVQNEHGPGKGLSVLLFIEATGFIIIVNFVKLAGTTVYRVAIKSYLFCSSNLGL
ncbi:unnamed protein product [Bursaphelenchus xylophilus]|uniref:(pine wood nematode) hypothetical protein n=1 Tax=Bursaphelenchus xylophilus TaxID=6326 RepID=A0A7I8X9G5_BURXY|nr:unnamed protein product [Bursaphelenchus xylophilus]CAG9132087.1 unnamed protein product [Bursaphelenchus xylophilus]